ncbi:uncharacterized protein FYW47_000833 [Aplochiton taeniatus]
MASNGDDATESALLYLIYQHLKDNGFQKAANVLKKHVTQVETPEASSLHDIYKSWSKLCELGQDAKQEPEIDSTTLKKSIKADPSSGQKDIKKEEMDVKPASEALLPPPPCSAAQPGNDEPASDGASIQAEADEAVPPAAVSKAETGGSESDEEEESPVKARSPPAASKTPVKISGATKEGSSDSDSSDSEEETSTQTPSKSSVSKPPALTKTPVKESITSKKSSSSDSDSSDSEDEETPAQVC